MDFSRRRRASAWRVAAAEWLVFGLVAVWATWPLAADLSECLPLGPEREPAVALLNLWTLWWNVDRFDHFGAEYWQAPIFFPAPDAFAFSEPQPLSGLAAWTLWRIAPSPEAVYNVLLLAHLALNGWAFCRLLRSWRIVWPAAFAGGLMVELLPMVHWQLGIFQLAPLWAAIGTIGFLERFTRQPTWPAALGLGLCGAATHLLCSYYGLMLSVLLLISIPVLFTGRLRSLHGLRMAAVSAALAFVLAAPVILVQWKTVRNHRAAPPPELVAELSVGPQHYLQTPWPQLISLPGATRPTPESPWALSPGSLKLLLAVVGAAWGFSRRKHRRVTLFALTVLFASVVLALGPNLDLGLASVYRWLAAYCPGYAQLRNIYRFAIFAQLMTVALAVLGLHGMWRLGQFVRRRFKSFQRAPALLAAAWLTFTAIVLLEVVPASPRLHCLAARPLPSWVAWVRDHSDPEDVVAIFPFPKSGALSAYAPTAAWMRWQIEHKRRMINGYSGLFPREVVEREDRMRRFPDQAAVEELALAGVDLVIVDEALAAAPRDWADSEFTGFTIARTHWDEVSRVAVYRLRVRERR